MVSTCHTWHKRKPTSAEMSNVKEKSQKKSVAHARNKKNDLKSTESALGMCGPTQPGRQDLFPPEETRALFSQLQ